MVSWSPSQLVPDFVHQRSLALKHLKLQAGYCTSHRGDWGVLTLGGRMRVDHFPHGENWEVFKHQFKMHDLCCHDKGWISFFGCLCLFWVSISEKPFRNNQAFCFRMVYQILGSNIFTRSQAQLKDFVELLESPARNFRGLAGNCQLPREKVFPQNEFETI